MSVFKTVGVDYIRSVSFHQSEKEGGDCETPGVGVIVSLLIYLFYPYFSVLKSLTVYTRHSRSY